MRIRKFLIILGFWVALLPHLGFSITAENVFFSITGFMVIIASFYLAAIEDKHKNKRIIEGETLQEASQKVSSVFSALNTMKKQTFDKIIPQQKQPEKPKEKNIQKIKTAPNIPTKQMFPTPTSSEEDTFVIEEDDNRPRIRKAVSDVKIKSDSFNELDS
jgi:hypothetical protein